MGALVLSMSVNQPLVTLVPVAPIVLMKRLFQRIDELPRSSVSVVSEISEVLIATEARLSRAVVAPAEAGSWKVGADPAPLLVNICPLVPVETREGVPLAFQVMRLPAVPSASLEYEMSLLADSSIDFSIPSTWFRKLLLVTKLEVSALLPGSPLGP